MSETQFKIETNVPIPPRKYGRPRKYFWESMRVNDSVSYPVEGGEFESAKVSAASYFRKRGWEMTTRELGPFGRIWRVR
jgi:hypothetical protein